MNATNRPAAWIRNVVPVVLAPEGACVDPHPYANFGRAGDDGRRACAHYPRTFDGCAPWSLSLARMLAMA